MISNDDRIKAFKSAPEALAETYASVETAVFLGSIREKYAIPKGNFTDLVGDTLLKLQPLGQFEQNLVTEIGLTSEIAKSVTQDLKQFFDKAEGTARPDANIESKERLELRPNGQPSIGSSAGSTAQPLTRDALMNAVSGKRTMAQDIEALRMRREAEKGSTPPPPPRPTI